MLAADFLERWEEFEGQNPALIQSFLDDAATQCPAELWGDRRDLAIQLLTAHRMALRLAQVGVMSGATDGKTYGDGLKATQYGQEFERMSDQLPVSGFSF